MKDIKGVFFDLGGTLRIAQEVPEHIQKAKRAMADLAGVTDENAFLEMIDKRYEPYRKWAMTEYKECGDFDLWHIWLLPDMPEEELRPVCHQLTYQYRQVKGLRHLVTHGLEVIKTLHQRGYKLGIISNLIGENEVADWLRDDDLAQYFDSVVLSSICHIRKPDPAIYDIGCAELGLKPGQCASVADNLSRDFTGAKAAGIGVNILFISPEKLAGKTITEENRPDIIINDFLELLDLPFLQ